MRRTASKPPKTPIEIAKLRSTLDEDTRDPDKGICVPDEAPSVPEEELDEEEELVEDEDAVSDVVLVVLVWDVEEIVDEGSRTSKMNISTTA